MKNKIEPNSFIALSDFHSVREPFERIKSDYLYQFDKIYILGDAIDRGIDNKGTGGFDLLIDIMKLQKSTPKEYSTYQEITTIFTRSDAQ